MAIAATPIIRSRDLLDLLKQDAPLQEKAVEVYRRLLAINELSSSMNAASDIESLQRLLRTYCIEYFPEDSVQLCIRDGRNCRKECLSGPRGPEDNKIAPLDGGVAGSVLQSGMPLWVADTNPGHRSRKFAAALSEGSARSLLVLPFSAMNRVVGCLEMTSICPKRFDEMEYYLGMLVATHLSSALENILTRQELATANARLRDHDLRLTQLNEKLQQLAHTDETTGLFNKRRLSERLEMEIARARRYGEILSCLMIDIDDFKQINDLYGHQAGDQILKQIGSLLLRSLRVTDFIARYGGEEFTVLLPRTNSAGAFRAAENLRSKFMAHEFCLAAKTIRLTISIGVAGCSSFDHIDAQQIILMADSALYRAKRNGKNRVCFSDNMEPSAEEVRILSNM